MPPGRALLLPCLLGLALPLPALAESAVAPPQPDPAALTRDVRQVAPEQPRERAPIDTPPTHDAVNGPWHVVATAIVVDGGADLPASEVQAAVSPFAGHKLGADDVQDLLSAVSGIARAHGYLFAHSTVPPQSMAGGVLHVMLDEGRIDEVRLTGAERRDVRAVLRPLVGHAAQRDEVERRLMLAGDLPGVHVARASYAIESGRGVLTVRIRFDRVDGTVSIDNRGLHGLGPERARLSFDVNGLLANDDQVTLQGIATPTHPRDLIALYGRYAIEPTGSGTLFAIYGSYGRTRSGGQWLAFDPNGESASFGISATQPLLRRARTSLWLTVAADRIAVAQWWNGQLAEHDIVSTLSASVNGYAPVAGGRLRAGGGIVQGVPVLGATVAPNPLASRPGAGARFTIVSAWADWQGKLAGPFSARLMSSAQVSSAPLPVVEQLTIGGPLFGRAYNWSERTGDAGILGSAELRAQVLDRSRGLVRWVQFYTFADGGHVANLQSDIGTGDLYSAGAGTRLAFSRRLRLELEAAFPINGVRYDSGDMSPRLSFDLASSF